MVGSPPENCTESWRRGLIFTALSSTSLISSQLSSWTYPTWLASMKQGSHIMLHRLVRSTVRTEPRPYRTVLLPCLCRSSSLCAGISRPGKFFSIQARNRESMAIRSSYCPCLGQSLTIHTWPSRSMICALISPTFSCIRSRQSFWPAKISSRASLTQPGQSESVWRGKPSVGLLFSQDFKSGFSDHFGVKEGLGRCLLNSWMVSKVAPATLHTAESTTFQTCVPQVFGISNLPHF